MHIPLSNKKLILIYNSIKTLNLLNIVVKSQFMCDVVQVKCRHVMGHMSVHHLLQHEKAQFG